MMKLYKYIKNFIKYIGIKIQKNIIVNGLKKFKIKQINNIV